MLLILLIALNAVLVFSAHQGEFSFSTLSKYMEKLAALSHENKNSMPEIARESVPGTAADPSADIAPYQDTVGEIEPANILPERKEEQVPQESKEEAVPQESTETAKNGLVSKARPQIRMADDKAITKRKLEFAIYKAIHDRAIRGVEVSAIDGIVYLDGQVATRQQKLAAVRATLGVPGVKDIRNRIVVVIE